jgi:hypothetical protein
MPSQSVIFQQQPLRVRVAVRLAVSVTKKGLLADVVRLLSARLSN